MYADKCDGTIMNGSASWNTGGENLWLWMVICDLAADEVQMTFDMSHDKY